MKDIKVTITVSPTHEELDLNQLKWLAMFNERSESYINRQLNNAIVENILPRIIEEYKDVKPTREQVKAAIIDKMAEKALNEE